MTPEQFMLAWKLDENELIREYSILHPFTIEELSGLGLNDNTIHFLVSAGLPKSAAPFLGFAKTNGNKYDKIGRITDHYNHLGDEFAKYIYIGSDGGGNPIVINTAKNDKIELLNHEDDFVAFYINSSINTFMQCLVALRNFVIDVLDKTGDTSNFSDEQFEEFKKALEYADANSIAENTFWDAELEMGLANREYYWGNPEE